MSPPQIKTSTSIAIDPYRKAKCRYCNSYLPNPFLELGSMPLANSLITTEDLDKDEFQCPLSLTFCQQCTLVQLTHAVPADLMFKNYLYVSSTTKTFQEHFAKYAKAVRLKLANKNHPVAVDIGSNDGLLVSSYAKEGMDAIGIEPAKNLSDMANCKGIKTLNRYFDHECVKQILKEHGPAKVISGNNVFAHIDDIQNVVRNVYDLLDADGMFVIEFPYLVTMLDETLFDMIYHEHLSYLSITALNYIFEQFHMKIFDIDYVPSHGGSCRVFIQKNEGHYAIFPIVAEYCAKEKKRGIGSSETYEEFAKKVYQVKKDLLQFVTDSKNSGKIIAGYGAPAKASTIINFCKLQAEQISFIVDDNPLKQKHFVPGAKIPIVPSGHLESNLPDYLIIFAWNFAKEIITKIQPLKQKGVRFLIPLPKPALV